MTLLVWKNVKKDVSHKIVNIWSACQHIQTLEKVKGRKKSKKEKHMVGEKRSRKQELFWIAPPSLTRSCHGFPPLWIVVMGTTKNPVMEVATTACVVVNYVNFNDVRRSIADHEHFEGFSCSLIYFQLKILVDLAEVEGLNSIIKINYCGVWDVVIHNYIGYVF